ncbi:major capsid protein [Sulfurovum sp.]|uniref:major capsid protein n=1 Tax=Sulfurovum sp. TaxID=1969726 RepID=UPI00260C8E75|nr:major capsid protein [Sulfurovum sp.]
MAVDIFTPRTMIRALNQENVANTFLLDLLFTNVEVSDTKYVDIDIVKGDERLAPFVAPIVEGELVEDQGYKTNTYEPPYIKPKFMTSAAQLLNERNPGTSIYGGESPAQRAALKLTKEIQDGEKMIRRREEWMAAQAITTGTITVSGKGVERVIDFGMAASHKVTLSGTDLWSDTTNSDPISDIKEWGRLVSDDGDANADVIIGGAGAIDALLGHPKVKEALDTRRIDLGLIDPKQLAKGVIYHGTIKDTGVNMDVYEYNGSYKDESGTRQRYIADGRIVVTSTTADFRRNYAAIQDLDAGLVAMPIFVKSWEEKDPSGRVVLLQSAPLPAPHQIDAIVTAAVL